MMKKMVFSWCVVAATCFSVAPLSSTISLADTKETAGMESLVKKVEKLHSLIAVAKAKGVDVSEALKLDQKSREAAAKSDFANANKLLDEAIKALESPTAKTAQNVESAQNVEGAEPVSGVSLMKKAEKLNSLAAEAKAKGTDITEVLKLDQQSREAAGKKDFASANKLLDEAINALEAPAAQTTQKTETTESTESKESTETASGESSAKQETKGTETTSSESTTKKTE